MYRYAILNENNICHTVYETSEERNNFDQKVIPLEIYDTKYINARWIDDLNDWEFPSQPGYIWIDNQWKDPNWEYYETMEKFELFEKIDNHLKMEFPNEEEKLNEILVQFNVELPLDIKNVTKETLQEIISYLDIN
jgi:hypothetical protein